MSKVTKLFCIECLSGKLIVDFVKESAECAECGTAIYFEAHMPSEIYDEIYGLIEKYGLEYGPLLLVYAAAGITELYYVDSEPEPYSREDAVERIVEGISGEEAYIYEAEEFLKIMEFIEKSGEGIDEERLRRLKAVTPQLKKAILVGAL